MCHLLRLQCKGYRRWQGFNAAVLASYDVCFCEHIMCGGKQQEIHYNSGGRCAVVVFGITIHLISQSTSNKTLNLEEQKCNR
jgi:hypothetical protein